MVTAGTVIAGRYEVVQPIGQGGMGEVWAAYDQRLDRRVAVKLLRGDRLPPGTRSERLTERFLREARVTARLEHPGVPTVFDAGAHGEDLFLVMQLLPGVNLSDLIAERGPLPVPWAVAIAAQVAGVLAAAHAASLVHRDLKPANVMVCPGGTVKVLDFGVAAVLDEVDAKRLTATGETVGTPAYMAPEQALRGTVGPQADLYALGCLLHEMLAGVPPFQGRTALAVLQRHLDEPPPPLRDARPGVPDEIERLVLDLLAKRPEDRPAGAAEVYARLLPHALATRGSGAPPAPADPLDPTRPYAYPLAPAPRAPAARVPAARAAAAGPPRPALPAGEAEIKQARERAAELAGGGRFTQAAEVLYELLRRALPAYGADHPLLLEARLELASFLLLGGDYRRALPEYQFLAAAFARAGGPAAEQALHCRHQAALCLAALGQAAAALREFRQLLSEQRRRLGEDHDDVLALRHQVVLLLASAGDARGARRELLALLREQRRRLGPGHPEVVELRRLLAYLDQLARP